jgi:hypothetical protein
METKNFTEVQELNLFQRAIFYITYISDTGIWWRNNLLSSYKISNRNEQN